MKKVELNMPRSFRRTLHIIIVVKIQVMMYDTDGYGQSADDEVPSSRQGLGVVPAVCRCALAGQSQG